MNRNAQQEEALQNDYSDMLNAVNHARLAAKSMKRNKTILIQVLSKHGLPWTWIDGVIRNLEHSERIIERGGK